jgi:membrane associated rhomboid family serine protease
MNQPVAEAAAHQEIPGDLEEAGSYATRGEGFEHGLVALALGEPYWLMPEGERYRLLVSHGAGPRVREELGYYDEESAARIPGEPPRARRRSFELGTPLLWAAAAAAVHALQVLRPGRLEGWGDLDSSAVFNHGQMWRIGTALFLHADIWHLVSNMVFGVLAFSAVLSACGHWRGWLLVLLSSLTGNLSIAALYYPGPYRSLGASTAIFAALGVLTGSALRTHAPTRPAPRWQSVFAPFAAGVSVLALFGAGGLEVDVGAHAAGFAAGMASGFILGPSVPRPGEPLGP